MSDLLPDQKEMWDRKHSQGELKGLRYKPNPFALVAEPKFPARGFVLDLGCGTGGDAVFFAQRGHKVIATDFSDIVIEQNRQKLAGRGVAFEILDMRDPFPFSDGTFNAVYSNLSLHYYDDATTKKVFEKIWRVLKTGGILAFTCKSVNDPYRQRGGQEVEIDLFVSSKGHVRHFFSESYVKELLANGFEIDLLEEAQEDYTGEPSAIIRCIARKKGEL